MDSTLVQSGVNLVNTLTEYLKSTVAFVAEQAPEVLRQILAYEITIHWCYLSVCALVFVTGIICLRRLKKWFKSARYNSYDHEFPLAAGFLVSSISIIITLVCIIVNATTLIKLYIAPKVFLLEYLARLR